MTTYGNHDGLLHAYVAESPIGDAYAVGSRKILGLPPGVTVPQLLAALGGDSTLYNELINGPTTRRVTPDKNRRLLSRSETVSEYFKTTGKPVGHGFTPANRRDGTAYYSFLSGGVRCIVLDTVNPNGASNGSLDQTQLTWLTSLLEANSKVRLSTDGVSERAAGEDHLIVIFSHHTIATMDNATTGAKSPGTRILGDQTQQLLLRYPNVVAWINGHTHVNNIIAHRRPSGWQAPGGFWEINTASHIDFPQQARIVELVDNRDGTLSIFGTIIDPLAPLRWTGTSSPVQLAALSRELAANDWLERVRTSTRKDTTAVAEPSRIATSSCSCTRRSRLPGAQPPCSPRRSPGARASTEPCCPASEATRLSWPPLTHLRAHSESRMHTGMR